MQRKAESTRIWFALLYSPLLLSVTLRKNCTPFQMERHQFLHCLFVPRWTTIFVIGG
jgi:hypothetical protein